jgi:hypothetical protein
VSQLLKRDDCPIDSQKTIQLLYNSKNCSWDTVEDNFQLRKWKMKGEEVLYESGLLGTAQLIQ